MRQGSYEQNRPGAGSGYLNSIRSFSISRDLTGSSGPSICWNCSTVSGKAAIISGIFGE
jgi:hypothetical protein